MSTLGKHRAYTHCYPHLHLYIEKTTPQSLSPRGLCYDVCTTSIGRLLLAYEGEALCYVGYAEHTFSGALSLLQARYPTTKLSPSPAPLVAPELYAEKVPTTELYLRLYGTPFQQSVWQSLAEIPHGEITTYSTLASQIGHPRSQRAVGRALGLNPLPLYLPCHRVLAQGNKLGGYALGAELKHHLLEQEGAIPSLL